MSAITYLGHSTVLIETESKKKIIIDPWLDGNPLCPESYKNINQLDYICLTHGHSDHASSAPSLAQKTGAIVFATYELAMLLIKEGVPAENIQPMNKGGTVIAPNSEIKISLTNAFHSSSFDASDGKTYYAGEPCGVVVTLESEQSIYHAGDTCLFKDMELIKQQFSPTVALLPIGDRFTMSPTEAAKAVELIQPKISIPIHHSTFPLLTGTPEQFKAAVKNTKVEILKPGGTYNTANL